MTNPYDYINEINFGKKNIIRDSDNPSLAEKGYVPYITNRQMSYFVDTILMSNDMNLNAHCDNIMQYEYYLHSVSKKKRFSKWSKPINSDDVKALSKYYNVSLKVAESYIPLHTEEQLLDIKEKLEYGMT